MRYAELGVSRINLMLPWDLPDDGLARFFDGVVAPLVDRQGA